MKLLATWILLISLSQAGLVAAIELERNDYLNLIVGNYVHGFKEFDTSVSVIDNTVTVGIYWDSNTQNERRAISLRERFLEQIPLLLERYEWARDISVRVSVYSEERKDRAY